MDIPFTQFLMPNGRQVPTVIAIDDAEISEKAQALIDAGYRFEIEMLSTGVIHMTVTTGDGEDVEGKLCTNDKKVPSTVQALIADGWMAVFHPEEVRP